MDFSNLIQKLKDARQNDPMFQSAKIAEDRMKQGVNPLDVEQTPEEKKYYDTVAGSVANSIAPVKGASSAIMAGQEALHGIMNPADVSLAKELANSAVTSGAEMPAVQRAQQALSRAQDFADRNKFQRLQKMLGR